MEWPRLEWHNTSLLHTWPLTSCEISFCCRASLQAGTAAWDNKELVFPVLLPCTAPVAAKSLQILPTRSLVSLSTALSICLGSALVWGQSQRWVWVRTGQLIPQFVDKLLVCRIVHERIGCSADCSEHWSTASKTFNMLALKPLRNAISFPGSWQAMTMGLGRPVYA